MPRSIAQQTQTKSLFIPHIYFFTRQPLIIAVTWQGDKSWEAFLPSLPVLYNLEVSNIPKTVQQTLPSSFL